MKNLSQRSVSQGTGKHPGRAKGHPSQPTTSLQPGAEELTPSSAASPEAPDALLATPRTEAEVPESKGGTTDMSASFLALAESELERVTTRLGPLEVEVASLRRQRDYLTRMLDEGKALYPEATKPKGSELLTRESIVAQYENKVPTMTEKHQPALREDLITKVRTRKPCQNRVGMDKCMAKTLELFSVNSNEPLHVKTIAEFLVEWGIYPTMARATKGVEYMLSKSDDKFVQVGPRMWQPRQDFITLGEVAAQ